MFLIANIVATSKALVTKSDALVPNSFLPPRRAREDQRPWESLYDAWPPSVEPDLTGVLSPRDLFCIP